MSVRVGVVALFEQAKIHKASGFRAKFDQIGQQLRKELGRQIRKPDDIKEFQRRLRESGLIPDSEGDKKGKTKEGAVWKDMGSSDLERMRKFFQNKEPGPKRDRQLESIEKELESRGVPTTKTELSQKKSGSDIPQKDWDDATNPRDYDEKLSQVKLTREGDKNYNGWSGSSDRQAVEAGSGSYGAVIRNPNGEYVKRGILSENEAKILDKVGKNDLGPRLIAADLDGKVKNDGNSPDLSLMEIEHLGLRNGRLAMTGVPGKDVGSQVVYSNEQIAGRPVADLYWSSMSGLHRLGIAHNDAHPGNLMVDEKTGKARWVDFGMAQDSPKAALAEAIGSFAKDSVSRTRTVVQQMASDAAGHFQAGNWQAQAWEVTGVERASSIRTPNDERKLKKELPVLARVWANNNQVQRILQEKYGFSSDEIGAIYAHGIRSPIESFDKGPWAKLSDSDARNLIEVFYEGV